MRKPIPRPSHLFLILILGALTTISPFSIDMYLPAFPDLALALNTTQARIAYTLSTYFIGLSLGQIIYGPLLDRFGRKRPLLIGLMIYILASLGCVTAKTVESLMVLRFLQALGGCVAQVASVAMVRDFFPVKESAKVFSLLVLVLGTSPLLAPTVGGFVTSYLGWQWVFILLALITAVILALVQLYLPEGHAPDVSISLKPKHILIGFLDIFKNPQFYTYALSGAFVFAGLFVYVASSPILFMNVYQVTPEVYGAIFAALSVGFIATSQLNIFFLKRHTNETIFLASILLQSVTAILFFVGTLYGWYDFKSTFALLFVFLAGLGLANPNATALALAPFSKNAGSASALLGFLQVGLGGLASAGVGFFTAKNLSLPPSALMAGSSVLGLLSFAVGRKKISTPVETHPVF